MDINTAVTACLMTIAFGMGLGLQFADFANVAKRPRGVAAGAVGQILLLPAIATLLAAASGNVAVAVGLLLIAVCPGGATSNYFTYLARGDVALSITLTAVSGSLAALSVPVIFNAASNLILDQSSSLTLPFLPTVGRILLFLVLPAVAGMVLRQVRPKFSSRIQPYVANGGFALLMILTPFLVVRFFGELEGIALAAFFWCAVLIPVMMGLGAVLGRLAHLPGAQIRALPIEVGVQNVALAITLALTFFDDPQYTAVPIAYLILMFVFVPAYVAIARKKQ